MDNKTFNSLCWVPKSYFQVSGQIGFIFQFPLLGSWSTILDFARELGIFQFPLLGSRWTTDEVAQYISYSFNSLCWVHQAYIQARAEALKSLSIPFVGFLSQYAGFVKDVNHSFNSLCWVPS